jgi:transposase, IS6 family
VGLGLRCLIERWLRHFRNLHCGSVRIAETYMRLRGPWRYLYRAMDEHGSQLDTSKNLALGMAL